MYGPVDIGSTSTLRGMSRILSALRELKVWGENVYWPWLRGQILLPLANSEEAAHHHSSTV